MNQINNIYSKLLKIYGPQGWWPLLELHDNKKGINPTKTGSVNGYHPGDYSFPKNRMQEFEICIGAILTQNTAWPNVEKALLNLKKYKAINPDNILKLDNEILKAAIRPAGYFNQKAKKLRIFSEFHKKLKTIPRREQLLSIWGIGPETADSILLYAYRQPSFVVDAYTKRLLIRMRIINERASYNEIKGLFEKGLRKDYRIYQEYHALIVEHSKHLSKEQNLNII